MPEARLHDASTIAVEVNGRGPTVLLPVNPRPVEGPQAEELRRWGADPALGRSLVDGLSDSFQVVAFDYEGHVLQEPKPGTLTPANVAGDLLAVADAAGADRFAYYGYSWLALAGLQLGIRTDRLAALAMGGYPPLNGPYTEMLRSPRGHELARPPASPLGPHALAPSEDPHRVDGRRSDPMTRPDQPFVTISRPCGTSTTAPPRPSSAALACALWARRTRSPTTSAGAACR